MLRSERRKSWEDATEVAGIIFIVLGVLVILSSLKWAFLLETGIGVMAVGLGLVSAAIAKKSDVKMAALANLEFDEKAVMMQRYLDYFTGSVIGQLHGGPLHPKYIEFLGDLRAMTHVAKWADKTKRQEARKRLNVIVRQLEVKMDGASLDLDEIRRLCDQIWHNC